MGLDNNIPPYPEFMQNFAIDLQNLYARVLDLQNCCDNNDTGDLPQLLSTTGKTITISNGNTVTLAPIISSWNGSVLTIDGTPLTLSGLGTNLAFTASPTVGTVTSDTGTDAVIPLATSTNSGLFSPSEKEKVSYLSITGAVNLDNVNTNLNSIITLSGLAANSVNLGVFTGTTISDNASIKGALQALETSLETKNAGIQWQSLGVSQGSTGTVTEFDVQGRVLSLSRTGNKVILLGSSNSNNIVTSNALVYNLSVLTDDVLIMTNPLATTVHLPGPTNLRRFTIKSLSTGGLTVEGHINGVGATTYNIPFGATVDFVSTASTWNVLYDANLTINGINNDVIEFRNDAGSDLYVRHNGTASIFTKNIELGTFSSLGSSLSKLAITRVMNGGFPASYGISISSAVSTIEFFAAGVESKIYTTTASPTLEVAQFSASEQALGGPATINVQSGFKVGAINNAATNYGVYSGLNITAKTNWNIYAAGTAPNYFNGSVRIGTTATLNAKLAVEGSSSIKGIAVIQDFTYLTSTLSNQLVHHLVEPALVTNSTTSTVSITGELSSVKAEATSTGAIIVSGMKGFAQLHSTVTNTPMYSYGGYFDSGRANATDVGTNAYLYGVYASVTQNHTAGATVSTLYSASVEAGTTTARGTIVDSYGVRAWVDVAVYGNHSANITNRYGIFTVGYVGQAGGSGVATVTNYYDAYLSGTNVESSGTVTNKWGLYQANSAHNNHFAGRVGVKTTSPAADLHVNGTFVLTPVSAVTASGYTPVEGQVVFVTTTNGTFTSVGVWAYYSGAWSKLG